jgi:hypothetical protein
MFTPLNLGECSNVSKRASNSVWGAERDKRDIISLREILSLNGRYYLSMRDKKLMLDFRV